MRIGIISDTHIPERAEDIPQEILNDFKNVDMIIHAGDLGDLAVLEKLKSACSNIKAVWGNMDPYEVRKKLPEKEVIKIGSHRIGVMHGYGPAAGLLELLNNAFKNDNVNLIIFGHSHSALNEKRGGILYFNPGSPTDKIFSPYKSYGIIEINGGISGKIIKL